MISYYTDCLFQVINENRSQLASKQIISVNSNYKLISNNNFVNIIFTQIQVYIVNLFSLSRCLLVFFLLKKINQSNGLIRNYKCAFWDFYLNNGNGDWNTFGCVLTIKSSIYNCSCNHTTNFAVLIVILI